MAIFTADIVLYIIYYAFELSMCLHTHRWLEEHGSQPVLCVEADGLGKRGKGVAVQEAFVV